jgi:hypothetical protein
MGTFFHQFIRGTSTDGSDRQPTISEIPARKEIMSDKFEQNIRATFVEAEQLLIKKHKDYGPKNISQSPGGPINGLRVRMHDKLARINHLYDNGADPQNESLRDSFIDLANYAIIALLVLDKEWPNE